MFWVWPCSKYFLKNPEWALSFYTDILNVSYKIRNNNFQPKTFPTTFVMTHIFQNSKENEKK